MRTTIDRAGRLVVPLGLRERVGLQAGGEVEVTIQGAAILIEPVNGLDLMEESGFLVLPPTGISFDDDAVRQMRLADQQ
ncbi:hypothetical protein BH23CHL8_BH23CHL8_14240 [soil metagenome]